MKQLILLSTPYSNPDPEVKKNNRRMAAVFVAALINEGIFAFSPITHGLGVIDESGENLPDDWNFWKEYCEAFVNACEKVYVANIPGWEESSGVAGEIEEAKRQGKEVYLIELYGTCESCNRVGMRHCAHADTCGGTKTLHRIVKKL